MLVERNGKMFMNSCSSLFRLFCLGVRLFYPVLGVPLCSECSVCSRHKIWK